MAGEPWNRVNIPFPSAVSSVRVPFNSTTGKVYRAENTIPFSVVICSQVWPFKAHVVAHERTFTVAGLWRSFSSWMCCCRVDARVKAVLLEKDKVLKLIQSEILQTEIRVMYELLYVLNNSYRGNKTFRGLKQVSCSAPNPS